MRVTGCFEGYLVNILAGHGVAKCERKMIMQQFVVGGLVDCYIVHFLNNMYLS